MRATHKTRGGFATLAEADSLRSRPTLLLALVAGTIALFATGCGDDDDFANEPRRAVPVELTGVIQKDRVTISPSKVGAGTILITISNQTDEAHSVTLEGESIKERVGPVPPLDTAEIQKTVDQGTYEVSAGSARAVRKPIKPATLEIGKPRKSSSGELLLP